jgi:hypothetical protein
MPYFVIDVALTEGVATSDDYRELIHELLSAYMDVSITYAEEEDLPEQFK